MTWPIAFALVVAAPAAPQTADELYRSGVEARTSGNPEQAAELLGRAAAASPSNADAQLQLGLALLALNRLDAAEAAFRRTLALAPDYDDAKIGLARISQRRGDNAEALATLERVPAENAEAAQLRSLLRRGSDGSSRYRLDIDVSYSDLDAPQRDWWESSAQLRYEASPTTTVTGRIEAARRFGRNDVFGEARVDQRLSEAARFYVSLGGTPSADFRPEWQIGLGGSLRARAGSKPTVLTLDARQANYRAGDIQSVSAGIEQYVADGRAWITGRWINVFDEDGNHAGGWLARGDVLADEQLRLFAGMADAPDTSEGVVIDTFSVFGGAAYGLSARHEVRVSLAHEDRESGSDRLQFALGLGVRF